MRFILAALSVTSIGFIIVMANTGRAAFVMQWVEATPYADKVLHFLLFGGLSFVLNWAFGGRRIRVRGKGFYMGTVVVGLYVIVDEFSHRFLPNRNFDYYDLLANFLGIAFFAVVFFLWVKMPNLRSGGEIVN